VPTAIGAGDHPRSKTVSSRKIDVLGISGSLRKGSFNSAALRAAAGAAPQGVTLAVRSLRGIPLYDEDLRREGTPREVRELAEAIAAADAVLIATPEYNYSIPGVLKNAIDWISRLENQPFDGKPLALMGASMGRLGTARAQYHLRQVFVFLNAMVLNRPEVMIGSAQELFDDDGALTDDATGRRLTGLLEALAQHTRRLA
jgi:chromate reductase